MNIQVFKPVAVAAEMFLAPQRGGIQDHGRRDLLSDDRLSARSAGVGCGYGHAGARSERVRACVTSRA